MSELQQAREKVERRVAFFSNPAGFFLPSLGNESLDQAILKGSLSLSLNTFYNLTVPSYDDNNQSMAISKGHYPAILTSKYRDIIKKDNRTWYFDMLIILTERPCVRQNTYYSFEMKRQD